MTPEDAYNEWLLLFGFREVSYDEIGRKGVHDTGRVLYDERYLKHYPKTKAAHYKLKQPHEIKENNEPTT
jgi:hypothetical protein